MKTRKRSRLLAGLLVLVMVMTLMPAAAFAADPAANKVVEDPYSDIDKKYSVYEPVAAPEAGDTVIIYNAGNGAAISSELKSEGVSHSKSVKLKSDL